MTVRRSKIQIDANEADSSLYRTMAKLEALHEALPLHLDQSRVNLWRAIEKLRQARVPVRMLMHPQDVERTR